MADKPNLDDKEILEQIEEDTGEEPRKFAHYFRCEICGKWMKAPEQVASISSRRKQDKVPEHKTPEKYVGVRVKPVSNGTYTWEDEYTIQNQKDTMKYYCSTKCKTAGKL